MEGSAEATTSVNARRAGMVIIVKSGDSSDLCARSLAKTDPAVYPTEHASARRDGPESFVTRGTSVGGILRSCQEDNSMYFVRFET